MKNIETNIPQVKLTDIAGAEYKLSIPLPFVAVDDTEIYEFTNTSAGLASGLAIAQLVRTQEHFIDKDKLSEFDGIRYASLTRTARNINKRIIPIVGFNPIDIEKDPENPYEFGGLRLTLVQTAVQQKVEISEAENEILIDPLDRRLQSSGIDIKSMTLAEKYVVDSLRSRPGVHVDIDAIIELMQVDHNIKADKKYVVRTLQKLVDRSNNGILPVLQFRVINGVFRIQWTQAVVLNGEVNEFNQKPRSVDSVAKLPNGYRL